MLAPRIRLFALATALALAGSLAGTALPAAADGCTTNTNQECTNSGGAVVTITGGSLALLDLQLSNQHIDTTTSASLTLDGLDHTFGYTFEVKAKDARGTGVGWNLTVSSTNFFDTGSATYMATGTVTAPTAPGARGTVSPGAVTNSPAAPTGIAPSPAYVFSSASMPLTGSSSPYGPLKYFNANTGTGKGISWITSDVTAVPISAAASAVTYAATLTVDIATGP